MPHEKWHIALLNGLSISRGSQTFHRFRTQKTGELLAYIAMNSGRAISREELADTIWAESNSVAGRTSLRTALLSLRHQLEMPDAAIETLLETNRNTVALASEYVTTDLARFNLACTEMHSAPLPERVQAGLIAASIYSGEFMRGCYSDWVFAERQRLSQAYILILDFIVRGLWQRGDEDQALVFSAQLITADPYREESYHLAMQLYSAAGYPGDAIRCFQTLKRLLHDELGEAPAQRVELLAGQIATSIGKRPEQRPQADVSFLAKMVSSEVDETDFPNYAVTLTERPSSGSVGNVSPPPIVRLPLALTKFFGRENELTRICQYYFPVHGLQSTDSLERHQQTRLVTLTGTGGAGKTRLAIEVANRLNKQQLLSVTFVSLVAATEAVQLADTILSALGSPEVSGSDPLEGIVNAIAGRPHLLILDNFEQLLPGYASGNPFADVRESDSARFIHTLLARVPSLLCLVTSRQCLYIEGEQEFPVYPLSIPANSGDSEKLLECASVQLFVDRAQRSMADFHLTQSNAQAIGSLCVRLEGLPLAVEMAAAWSSVLAPGQLLERLSKRFDLLVNRREGRVARHQTLRGAIGWSYYLLSPELQTLFAQLSVFSGGFSAEAVESICQCGNAIESLQALRDRSLIYTESILGETESLRFRMLETLRDFAAEQVPDVELVDLRQRHLAWYAAWADSLRTALVGTNQVSVLQHIGLEIDNVFSALRCSPATELDAAAQLKLIASLGQYWCLKGHYVEIRGLLDRYISRPDNGTDAFWRALSLNLAGTLATYQEGYSAAARYFEQCLVIAREHSYASLCAAALTSLGNIAVFQGDAARALECYEQCRQQYEALGNVLGVASMHGAFAFVAHTNLDYKSALPHALKAIELQRQEKNLSGITHHLRSAAINYAYLGDCDSANSCFNECLDGYWELQDMRGLAEMLHEYATMLPITAASVRLMSAANRMNGVMLAAGLVTDGKIRACLGAAAFDAAWMEGSRMTSLEAVAAARELISQNHEWRSE